MAAGAEQGKGGFLIHREDERRLIQALVARDRQAWRQFVENFQGLVYARVARTALEFHRAVDRSDIEDICAEVFAGLVANDFASLRRFEGRSSLATWLSVVARRVCVRWLEKSRPAAARPESFDDAAHLPVRPSRRAGVLAALIQTEDNQRLKDMFERLNPADRQVLRMFYHEGASYAEISRQMKISINTVGPKLQRAQRRLRKLIEPARGQPARKT